MHNSEQMICHKCVPGDAQDDVSVATFIKTWYSASNQPWPTHDNDDPEALKVKPQQDDDENVQMRKKCIVNAHNSLMTHLARHAQNGMKK